MSFRVGEPEKLFAQKRDRLPVETSNLRGLSDTMMRSSPEAGIPNGVEFLA